jgi:ankyrin repeat protein/predicted Ser/Thr protein kinase
MMESELILRVLETGDIDSIKKWCAEDTSWLRTPQDGVMLPIHIAAKYGQVDVLACLIEIDSMQLNLKDEFMQTPLLWAAASGQVAALKFLIDLNADFECSTRKPHGIHDGYTPLKWASEKKHDACVKILQEAHCRYVSQLISRNSDLLHTPDDKGEFLLIKSIRLGHEDAVRYLISCGADIHVRHHAMQFNLLHIATKYGHLSLVKYLHEEVHAQFLDQKDVNGQTAILWAAAQGDLEIVQYLTEKGADLSVSTNSGPEQGRTPLLWAMHNKHHDIVAFLIFVLSAQQPFETLFPYIRDVQVVIKLMEHHASYVPILLQNSRIYDLIQLSTLCQTTKQLIHIYEPRTSRRPSRYGTVDKYTGQTTFFSPVEPALGRGTYGEVRKFTSPDGEALAIKSNVSDFSSKEIAQELHFMQKAYPEPNVYQLFNFSRKKGDTQTKHYRYIMPFYQGENFKIWANKESSAHRLAQVIHLVADELYQLHELQIIHGDLTHNNILVAVEANQYIIRFVDFGFAYPANGEIKILCTSDKRYPPERQKNSTKPSPKQDIYMLGKTFEKFIGNHPNYDTLRLHYPSIPTFISLSIHEDPLHRPSLKSFCDSLKSEINDAITSQEQPTINLNV